jgi:murein DD-endopeptidase MepM/ murein hydrolase activator NlpD
MKRFHLFFHVVLGGMLLVPVFYYTQSTSEAAGAPAIFRPDLLLNQVTATPIFAQINRLEYPVIANYTMQKGEDFWMFCKRFQLNRDSVRSSNDLDVLTLPAGTVLKIPNQKGTLYTVTDPENLSAISRGYQRGMTKGNRFQEEILLANSFPMPDLKDSERRFPVGTVLFLPDVLKPFGFPAPFQGRISSSFGSRRHPVLGIVRPHRGIDIPKPFGTRVYAARRGVVSQAGWVGGYGNMVEIQHTKHSGSHIYTRYGHLSKITVHEGQSVHPGTLIGLVGTTGISTGPHLHYEVRDESGHANNPMIY